MNKQLFSLTSPKSPDEFERYYRFRWQQLRQRLNLPIGSERDECEKQAFHCMAVTPDNNIIGVGRIQQQEVHSMRIRYMAVTEAYRRKGVGSQIIQHLLGFAVQNKCSNCWLNARSEAIAFYQSNGFKVMGLVETDLVIPHYRMEISLDGE